MIEKHNNRQISRKYLPLLRNFLFLLFIIIYWIGFVFDIRTNIINYIEIFIVIVLILLEYKRSRKIISPLIFWFGFWLSTIVVAKIDYNIYNLDITWNYDLFFLVFINTIVFYITYILFEKLTVSVSLRENNSNLKKNSNEVKYNILILYKCTISLLLLGIVAYIINVISFGYIPQLSSDVDSLRRPFVTSPYFSIVNITRIAFVFVPLLIKNLTNKNKRFFLILCTLILILFNILTGWRTYVFQIIIMIATSQMIIFDVKTKKDKIIERRSIVRYGIVAIILIAFIAITRGVGGSQHSVIQLFEVIIEHIYLYIAPNFLNMQNSINSIQPNYNFIYTSEFIWGIFVDSNKIPGYEPLSFSIGAFNVSTYLLHPYGDFGIFGTIIWTFFIGLISAFSFIKSVKTKAILNIVMMSIMNITIFNMHNGFFLRSSSVIVWLVITILISKLSTTK